MCFTRSQLGPFLVLKFVRSRVLGRDLFNRFPKSLVTVKCNSNTKLAVNTLVQKSPQLGPRSVQHSAFLERMAPFMRPEQG